MMKQVPTRIHVENTVYLFFAAACYAKPLFACSVCGFGEDNTSAAFLLTTGIMTAVPLVALGCGLFFFLKRFGDKDDES